jgi:hypothetical protein
MSRTETILGRYHKSVLETTILLNKKLQGRKSGEEQGNRSYRKPAVPGKTRDRRQKILVVIRIYIGIQP